MRTAEEGEEREEMAMGRRLERRDWRLESSQRARRVSMRSSISSISSADFCGGDGGGSAIFVGRSRR